MYALVLLLACGAFLTPLRGAFAFACVSSRVGGAALFAAVQGEERYLEPNDRVLDLVAYWQRLFEEEHTKKQKKKVDHTNMYRLVYKVCLALSWLATPPSIHTHGNPLAPYGHPPHTGAHVLGPRRLHTRRHQADLHPSRL